VLLVILVLALIDSSIRPRIDASPIHFAGLPLALEGAPLLPDVLAVAFNFVVDPLAFEFRAVGPLVGSLAPLLAFLVDPCKLASVWERSLPLSILLIVLPPALVRLTVEVNVLAEA